MRMGEPILGYKVCRWEFQSVGILGEGEGAEEIIFSDGGKREQFGARVAS